MNTWRGLEENRLYVKCKNKTLYYFVEKHLSWDGIKKSKSVKLSDFSSYSNDFLFGFLCGIIDADGGTKRLYISTSSKNMMENLKEICEKLGIAINVLKYDVFNICLGKADFKRVCKEQVFSSIKHRGL